MSAQIQYCPPSPHRPNLDRFQFDFRPRTNMSACYVGAQNGLNGWESNGLSWADFSSMQTARKQPRTTGRRLKTPLWMTNDEALRCVLAFYLQKRAGGASKRLKADGRMTARTRMERAQKHLQQRAPRQMEVVDNLCREYCELRAVDPARAEMLARQIQSLDCQIIFNRRPAALLLTILYQYYREGLNSAQVASAVGMNAPAIRQMLYRVWKTAKELGFEPETLCEYKLSRAGSNGPMHSRLEGLIRANGVRIL
jgi:hypothetical protein